jgi:transposase
MTSRERLSRPGQAKTDPVDAVAIARITAREKSLPPVRAMTGAAADLRVLSEYRDQLVNERTPPRTGSTPTCCGCGPATSTSCRT